MAAFNEDAKRIYELLVPRPPELLRGSRVFIKEGSILQLKTTTFGQKWSARHAFLFNDAFLLAEKLPGFKEKYRLRIFVDIRPGVHIEKDEKETTAFRLITPVKKIMLSGTTPDESMVWISLLQASLVSEKDPAASPPPPRSSKRIIKLDFGMSDTHNTIRKEKSESNSSKRITGSFTSFLLKPQVRSIGRDRTGTQEPVVQPTATNIGAHVQLKHSSSVDATQQRSQETVPPPLPPKNLPPSYETAASSSHRPPPPIPPPPPPASSQPEVQIEGGQETQPQSERRELPPQFLSSQSALASQLRKQIVEHQREIRKSIIKSQRLSQALVSPESVEQLQQSQPQTGVEGISQPTPPPPSSTLQVPSATPGVSSGRLLGMQSQRNSVLLGTLSGNRPKSVVIVPRSLTTNGMSKVENRLSVYSYYGLTDLVNLAGAVDLEKLNQLDELDIPNIGVSASPVEPPQPEEETDYLQDLDGKNLVVEDQIGTDSQSGLMMWHASIDDHPVVLRQLTIPGFEDLDGIWHAFKAETRMLKTLQHPNVAKYLGSYLSKESREINVIIEFLEGGSLANLIRHDGPFTERFAARLAFQVLEGLHFLHSNHIFHRDLTPNNVVLNKHGIAKLTDYCTVEKLLKLSLNSRNSLVVASPWYSAPEVIESQTYSAQMDSWSLGCIVYHLLTGRRPFDDYEAVGAAFQVVEEEITIPSEDFSELAQEFMKACLIKSVDQRPTAEKLLQHPWIKYHVIPGGEANLITLIQQEKAPNSKTLVAEEDVRTSLRLLGDLMRWLDQALEDGHLKAAVRVSEHLRQQSEVIQSKQLNHPELESLLQEIEAKLQKVKKQAQSTSTGEVMDSEDWNLNSDSDEDEGDLDFDDYEVDDADKFVF